MSKNKKLPQDSVLFSSLSNRRKTISYDQSQDSKEMTEKLKSYESLISRGKNDSSVLEEQIEKSIKKYPPMNRRIIK